MSYCARGERCTEDVVTKLKTWEVPESLQRGIIETLYSENFLDDSRFAKSFANDKWRFNGWGKIRISYALQLKKIKRQLIEEALEQIPSEAYFAQLGQILSAKWESLHREGKDDIRNKVYAFGLRRGFEPDLVIQWLDRFSRTT